MTSEGDDDDHDQFWFPAGISDLQEKNGSLRVRIPDRLFREKDIIEPGKDINWHYNTVTGVLVIVSEKYSFDSDDYDYSGEATDFSPGDNGDYRCVVPKVFFKEGSGSKGTGIEPEFKDLIQLSSDEYLYFVYNKDMVEGKPKSCYVLTEQQFDKRFSDSDHWDGELDQAPKFIS